MMTRLFKKMIGKLAGGRTGYGRKDESGLGLESQQRNVRRGFDRAGKVALWRGVFHKAAHVDSRLDSLQVRCNLLSV